jgi:hypothetical protein
MRDWEPWRGMKAPAGKAPLPETGYSAWPAGSDASHPSYDDLSLGTPVSLRSAWDDSFELALRMTNLWWNELPVGNGSYPLANICLIPRNACRVRSSFSISENLTWPSP